MSQGTIPIVMCDYESGCDEWFIDDYEMGASNWRELVPEGWAYNPYDTTESDLCPEHATDQSVGES